MGLTRCYKTTVFYIYPQVMANTVARAYSGESEGYALSGFQTYKSTNPG